VLLLKTNIPLYLQYVLARYFESESGYEQLCWIFQGPILQIFISGKKLITKLTTKNNKYLCIFNFI
jgi:hypothetical protein